LRIGAFSFGYNLNCGLGCWLQSLGGKCRRSCAAGIGKPEAPGVAEATTKGVAEEVVAGIAAAAGFPSSPPENSCANKNNVKSDANPTSNLRRQ